MTDSRVTHTGQNLSAHFAKSAVLPKRELSAAESFLQTFEQTVAAGQKPTAAQIAQGRQVQQALDTETTRFLFNFAQVLAEGQVSEEDATARVQQLENTAERLRRTMDAIGRANA